MTARRDHCAVPASAGIGLRFQHHEAIRDERPPVAWLEVHTENYLGDGPAALALEAIRRDYPVSLHGVGLSLGSADGLDARHLEDVRQAVQRFEPGLVSEHLSWSMAGGSQLPDLLPLPMTDEALSLVCRHVDQTQDFLRRRILIENPSTYLRFRHSTIDEWDFLAALAQRTGCGILCDVNNVFVSAANHGWDASAYLAALPPCSIGEVHLAGHAIRLLPNGRSLCIDDHGSSVAPEVWALYAEALARFGQVPTLIEWDTDVPPLGELLEEASRASDILAGARRDLVG